MGGKKRDNKPGNRAGGNKQQGRTAAPPQTRPLSETDSSTPVVVKKADAEEAQQIPKTGSAGYQEQSLRLEKWQHRFTAALVFVGFAQIFTAIWASCEMKWQNDIMIRQMGQTDKQLELTQQQNITAEFSASAAQDAVNLARETARMQLRAYLAIAVEIIDIKEAAEVTHPEIVIRLRIKNYGQTPASKVRFVSVCSGTKKSPAGYLPCDVAPSGSLDIAPQQEYVIPCSTYIERSELASLRQKKSTWYAHIAMTYLDVYQRACTTDQQFKTDRESGFGKGDVLGGDDAGIDEASQAKPTPASSPLPSRSSEPEERKDHSMLIPQSTYGIR